MKFSIANRILGIIFILFTLITSCESPRKYVVAGRYDEAIPLLVNKLRRNQSVKKHDENAILLERAYIGAQQRDLEQIEYLKKENRGDNWIEITDRYNDIKRRQLTVQPLLPLYITSLKRNANIKLINVDDQLISSKGKAAEFYYNEAKSLLATGNRFDARKAYQDMLELKKYTSYSTFKNADSLKNAAYNAGITYVLVKFKNLSNAVIPQDFESELLKIAVQDLNTNWIVYHTKQVEFISYDYYVAANIKGIMVSPESNNSREYEETKTVADGWQYVLDSKGNVKKDSLGNDIKVPKTKIIKCTVKEIRQLKTCQINGVLDIFNIGNNQLAKTAPIASEAVFENYASKAMGDLNALTEATKKKLGNQPMPFPTDLQMIARAGETLKPVIKSAIVANKDVIE